MRVAQLFGNQIELRDIDKVSLDGKKGAIVRVLGCGLCGSDIVKFRHGLAEDGTVLGHEIVAIVEDINSSTEFKKGDRIVCSHHIPCFECHYCKGGSYSMCQHFKKTNIIPGGFSEYVYLSEEHLQNVAHKVPEDMTDEEISFYEPLGCCIRAVERANLKKGDNVLVIGLGSIGLLMGQALKAYGMNVYGCDLMQDRIDLAISRGIIGFNSLDVEKSHDFIYNNTNKIGADCIFMTSGADAAIPLALKTVRNGGKILVFSSTPKDFGYANNEVYYRELTIMGSYSPRPQDLAKSFELLTSRKVNVEHLSTDYQLNDIVKAFDDTITNKILKAYIKIGE